MEKYLLAIELRDVVQDIYVDAEVHARVLRVANEDIHRDGTGDLRVVADIARRDL